MLMSALSWSPAVEEAVSTLMDLTRKIKFLYAEITNSVYFFEKT